MLNAIRNTKKKAWIIIGVSASLILGSAGVVYMDYTTIGEEEAKIGSLKNQNSMANVRISKIRGHEDRVLKERMVVKERVKILPEDKEINQIVKKITDFSAASGVEVTDLDDSSARNRGRRKSAGAFLDIAYKLGVRGTLAQFLDFMNRFESHDRFVKVKSLAISSDQKPSGDDEEGPAIHQIELVLETYVYQPGQNNQAPVNIVNADKRTLALMEEGGNVDPFELDFYDYVIQNDRRDIFADPRVKSGVNAELRRVQAKNIDEQEKMLEQFVENFGKLKQALEDEAKLLSFVEKLTFAATVNEQLTAFSQELETAQKTKSISARSLQGRFEDEVVTPFRAIYKIRRENDSRGLAQKELEAEYRRMSLSFDAGRYEDVIASAKALGAVKTADSGPKMKGVFSKIEKISLRASTRHEFAQIPIAVTGYVYQPSQPTQGIIIINSRAYSPGEVFAEGVIVGKIDLSQVVFLYKEEEIIKSLD
ncbi:MAG: Tfp pilus assembly protein PilO [Planctomycetota bacterium]